MREELIFVGTELLLGQIVNTNAAYLGENLANLGVDLYYSSVVGDNLDRIRDTIRFALNRSDLVIITGGLGPTHDDITKAVLAKFFNDSLYCNQEILKEIFLDIPS